MSKPNISVTNANGQVVIEIDQSVRHLGFDPKNAVALMQAIQAQIEHLASKENPIFMPPKH